MIPETGQPSGLSIEETRATMDGEEQPWHEQKPLEREADEPGKFPTRALGEILGPAVEEALDVIQAPDSIMGNSALAVASLSVQAHADPSIDGRSFPCSLYLVSVAQSGERKSACDNHLLRPVRNWVNERRKTHAIESDEYTAKKASYDSQRSEILSRKKETPEEKEAALSRLGASPAVPPLPTLTFGDATFEGAFKQLERGLPSQGLFSDEGGVIVGGHAMNAENQMKTAAGLSQFWDGNPLTRVRSGDGASTLYGRRLTMHLMLQPVVAESFFGNRVLSSQGLPNRVLLANPKSTAGGRLYKEVDLSQSAANKRYEERVTHLLNLSLPLAEGATNELKPRPLYLQHEAKRLWIDRHNKIESQLADGKALSAVRGFASKAPEHAARLAAVLTLFDNPDARNIDLEHMEAGWTLLEFYLNEALRLFDISESDPELTLARTVRDWIWSRNKPLISLVEIYRYGPNRIRNAKTALKLMGILWEHGYVRPATVKVEFEGITRKDVWEVRPIG